MEKRNRFKVATGAVRALPFLGYRPKPQYVVETSAGRVAIRVHDAQTLTAENVDGYTVAREQGREYGQGAPEYLTVRGIDYTASATFNARGEPGDYETFGRRGSFSRDDVSQPAARALRDILRAAVLALLESNGEAVAIAQALASIDKRQEAAENVRKASEALDKATAALAAAEAAAAEDVRAVAVRGIDFAPFVAGRRE